jgi:hypothetical protein
MRAALELFLAASRLGCRCFRLDSWRVFDVQTVKMFAAAGAALGIWATHFELILKAASAALLFAYMALRFWREWTKQRPNCVDCPILRERHNRKR